MPLPASVLPLSAVNVGKALDDDMSSGFDPFQFLGGSLGGIPGLSSSASASGRQNNEFFAPFTVTGSGSTRAESSASGSQGGIIPSGGGALSGDMFNLILFGIIAWAAVTIVK